MKLFEKIRRFIRDADRAVTDVICERLDNTAEKLENFARNLDPEAFQESKMRESWEGRPKTDPETAARLTQMPVASLEDVIDQTTEGMVKVGVKADEAADAIKSAISAVDPKRYTRFYDDLIPAPVRGVVEIHSPTQVMAKAGLSADEAARAIAKAIAQKPEPLRHLTNNWRKMHGLPMHRKPASFRRRRKGNGTGKQSK